MARLPKPSTLSGKGCYVNFFLNKNRKTVSNKYQLLIRLTIAQPKTHLLSSVIFEEKTVTLFEGEFSNLINQITAWNGCDSQQLRRVNAHLNLLGYTALSIGEELAKKNAIISHSQFGKYLYDTLNGANENYNLERKYNFITSNPQQLEGYVKEIATHTTEKLATYLEKETDFREHLTTEQIYKRQKYNRENIFECFFACWYPDQKGKEITNTGYQSIIVRLLQYRENLKPSENITDFNYEWCYEFFEYLFSTGWMSINTKTLDVLNYDKEIFQRETVAYELVTMKKHLKMLKGVVRALSARKILPAVDLSAISLKDFVEKKRINSIDETSRDEMRLTKKELDYLFYYDLKDKELTRVKHIFIIQVMCGGLRMNEYNPQNLKLIDTGHGYQAFSYQSSHNEKLKEIINPVTEYTESILKIYKGKIPFFQDANGNDTGLHENETNYNAKLKEIAEKVGFNRLVKAKIREDKTLVKGLHPIKNLITSLWARKTLVQILQDQELLDEQVKWFSGHSNKRDAFSHYSAKRWKDVEKKRELIIKHKVKPEKV